jgi:hypothetical protein
MSESEIKSYDDEHKHGGDCTYGPPTPLLGEDPSTVKWQWICFEPEPDSSDLSHTSTSDNTVTGENV